jgi:hypothetical protein
LLKVFVINGPSQTFPVFSSISLYNPSSFFYSKKNGQSNPLLLHFYC